MVENLLSIQIQNGIDCFRISTKLTFLLWTPSLFIEDWWPKNGLSLSHGYAFLCMSSKIMAQANNLHNTIKCPRFNKSVRFLFFTKEGKSLQNIVTQVFIKFYFAGFSQVQPNNLSF